DNMLHDDAAVRDDTAFVVYFAFVDPELAKTIRIRKFVGAPLLLTPAGLPLPAAKGESTLCSDMVCYRTLPPSVSIPAPALAAAGPVQGQANGANGANGTDAAACEIKGHITGTKRKLYILPGT